MAPKQAHGEPWKTSQNAWWCKACGEWVRAKKCNCYICDRKKPTGNALKLFSSTPEGKAAQKEIDERSSKAPPKAAPKASPKAPVNKTVANLEADLKKKDAELKKKAAEITKLKQREPHRQNPMMTMMRRTLAQDPLKARSISPQALLNLTLRSKAKKSWQRSQSTKRGPKPSLPNWPAAMPPPHRWPALLPPARQPPLSAAP